MSVSSVERPVSALQRRMLEDMVYKFLFDLTDGGNWLVDVQASS